MAAASFEREIALLSEKYARNPASRIFAPLADAYRKAGRTDEAVSVAQQGLRHHPEYIGGRMVLARSHFDAGDLELAAAEFRRVLEVDAQNLLALRALGEIAEQRDDALGAEAWYRRALEVDPTNLQIQERLEELTSAPARDGSRSFEEGSAAPPRDEPSPSSDAPVAAERAPAFGPSTSSGAPDVPGEIATVTLAEIYAEQGLHERALGIYRRILAEDPDNEAIRQRAERLEARSSEERARLDAEAGSALGGFVPGELQPTGDEMVTAEPAVEAFDVPSEALEAGHDAGGFPERAPRRPSPEPWAFLLQDEPDADPDEVFGGARSSSPAQAAPAPLATAGEDEDLRKFQEWLRSLQ